MTMCQTRQPLTPRELDVLVLVARGLSNKAIADRLCIAVWTVNHHLENISARLGVHSRIEAVVWMLREGHSLDLPVGRGKGGQE